MKSLNRKQENKNLLVFGYGLAVICLWFAWRLWHKGTSPVAWISLTVVAVILCLVTSIRVTVLKPFYRRWMIVAHFIGTIVGNLLFGIIFFCLFAPIGIILRLLGKDLLDRKIQPQRDSYWISKISIGDIKERYERQF